VYTATVSGNAGDTRSEIVNASGQDSDNQPVNDQDSVFLLITDLLPSATLTTLASPASLPEPGGAVTYTVTVTNTSAGEALTIDGLSDTIHGDLASQGNCSVPQTLEPTGPGNQDQYQCVFAATVSGNAGETVTNTISVTASDDDGNSVIENYEAGVSLTDLPSAISVTHTAEPALLPEPGGPVSFTLTVENLSAADVVTVTSLVEATKGDLSSQADCTAGAVIAAGASYSCSYSTIITGDIGLTFTRVLTVGAADDDGNVLSAAAEAMVTIVERPVTILYLPMIVKPPPTTFLYVTNNNTGGNVTFSVLGAGVSCSVPNNTTRFCGSFPPGTYTVRAVSSCGEGERTFDFDPGNVTRVVSCD
jgi:uncharacterized repeat protein (TIGR01451 family)